MYCTLYSKYCNILGVQKHEYFFRQFRNDLGLVYFVLINSEDLFQNYISGLEIYIWTIFQDLNSISEI